MSTTTTLRQSILQALLADRLPSFSSAQLSDDRIALGAGGLEVGSMALLQAFINLETSLGFTFDDGPVANARLRTLGDFIGLVMQEVSAHRSRVAQP